MDSRLHPNGGGSEDCSHVDCVIAAFAEPGVHATSDQFFFATFDNHKWSSRGIGDGMRLRPPVRASVSGGIVHGMPGLGNQERPLVGDELGAVRLLADGARGHDALGGT